jgi:deoxyadenosine/deoxycytidine kinase
MKEKIIINIDGPIGAGKTTFAKVICEKLKNVHVVDENVDSEEGILIVEKYYKNKTKYAFEFDVFLLESKKTKVAQIHKDIEDSKEEGIHYIVFDRSVRYDRIFTNHRYDYGFLDKHQFNELECIKDNIDVFVKEIIQPVKTFDFFIKTSFKTCLERIEKRKRLGEIISFEENEVLYKLHWDLLQNNLWDTIILEEMFDYEEFEKYIK